MSFPAKTTFTLDWTTLADVLTPGLYTATQLKSMFNQRDQELLDFVNSILATLTAVAPGSSGSENIGSAAISGVAGATPYAQLVDLKAQLQAAVIGTIPDGTLDYVKLNAATKSLLTEYGLVRQAFINSNFDIWQRGTSASIVNQYNADRWYCLIGATSAIGTVTRQAFTVGQTQVPNNPKYFARINPTTLTGCTTFNFEQRIEDVSSFSGQNITISFWAKSDTPKNINVSARQSFGSGGSGDVGTSLATLSLTTSWQIFTVTLAIPSISGKIVGTIGDYLSVAIGMPLTGTYAIDIAQVLVNAGSTALPFQPKSFADELQLCRRYFRKSFKYTVAPVQNVGAGDSNPVALQGVGPSIQSLMVFQIWFDSPMRVAPTVTTYNPSAANNQIRNFITNTDFTATTVDNIADNRFRIYGTSPAASAATDVIGVHWSADAEL